MTRVCPSCGNRAEDHTKDLSGRFNVGRLCELSSCTKRLRHSLGIRGSFFRPDEIPETWVITEPIANFFIYCERLVHFSTKKIGRPCIYYETCARHPVITSLLVPLAAGISSANEIPMPEKRKSVHVAQHAHYGFLAFQ